MTRPEAAGSRTRPGGFLRRALDVVRDRRGDPAPALVSLGGSAIARIGGILLAMSVSRLLGQAGLVGQPPVRGEAQQRSGQHPGAVLRLHDAEVVLHGEPGTLQGVGDGGVPVAEEVGSVREQPTVDGVGRLGAGGLGTVERQEDLVGCVVQRTDVIDGVAPLPPPDGGATDAALRDATADGPDAPVGNTDAGTVGGGDGGAVDGGVSQMPSAELVGTETIAYGAVGESDCRGLIGAAPGQVLTLPCSVRYRFTGRRP